MSKGSRVEEAELRRMGFCKKPGARGVEEVWVNNNTREYIVRDKNTEIIVDYSMV